MSLKKANLKIDWCSHEAAKFAVMNWHYSRSMPAGKLIKIGAWENGKFIGCVLFGRGASPKLGAEYGCGTGEVCELVRVALDNHSAPVSRIVRIALKFLKSNSAGLTLCISFADSNQGHVGGIYQAGNWIYTGKTPRKKHYKDANGRVWHSRQVQERGYVKEFGQMRKCLKPSDCEAVFLDGKYKYLMPLTAKMRDSILHLSRPYPKKKQAAEA